MKFKCLNDKCSRADGLYDETEFSQFLFSLDSPMQNIYLSERLCPECFMDTVKDSSCIIKHQADTAIA